jgi:hypothetical protein
MKLSRIEVPYLVTIAGEPNSRLQIRIPRNSSPRTRELSRLSVRCFDCFAATLILGNPTAIPAREPHFARLIFGWVRRAGLAQKRLGLEAPVGDDSRVPFV